MREARPPGVQRHRRRCDVTRLLFGTTAGLVTMLGIAMSVWISRATLADWFVFGDTKLWSALDPVGAYFQDIIFFFEPGPVEVAFHPGLPMTFSGAAIAKCWYIVHSAIEQTEPYTDYWVRHRFLLGGLLAMLSTVALLACCHPLFVVLRHFMNRSIAYVGCVVFLSSVPVLLWVGRFSPEAWMLYFTLWSIHFSLRALGGDRRMRTRLAMGGTTALAVLSKLLVLPLLAFNVYCLVAGQRVGMKTRALGVGLFILGIVVGGGPLLAKLPVSHLIERTQQLAGMYPRVGAPSLTRHLMESHQRPFLGHYALVFTFGTVGLVVMYRTMPRVRRKLVPLAATIMLMVLVVSPKPLWHYYFGFYWSFVTAATCGLAVLIGRRAAVTEQGAAIAAGLLVIATCDAWLYPGIVTTYRTYRDAFHRRATLVRVNPAMVPAPWEIPLKGFETTRDPSKLLPAFGPRLDPALQRQRREGDGARRSHPGGDDGRE